MNYDKKEIQKLSKEVGSCISNGKRMALEAIYKILATETSEDHTFIELDSPVTINMYRESSEDIVRVYRDGGLVVEQFSQGRMNINDTIEDLNVSQLFDLLIALDENGTDEEEVA